MKKIIWMVAQFMLGIFIAWWLLRGVPLTQASVFWAGADSHPNLSEGVLQRDIGVCFVGTAVTTRAGRVAQIIDYIGEFEQAANIRFQTVDDVPVAQAVSTNISLLECPDSTSPGFPDFYPGTIRVLIPGVGVAWGTGPVPGDGCPMSSQPDSSWATEPWLLGDRRPCLYNLKLGDDDFDLDTGKPSGTPWLNHTLHEFGHSLGLAHEHARADENANCVPAGHGEAGAIVKGYMTPYDKDSVMHYKFKPTETPSCSQIGTNYSNSGFTEYDKLALHILYPEDNRVAEFVGTTVVLVNEPLNLRSAWMERGANINVVANNFLWKIDGVTLSTGPTLTAPLNSPGVYTLEFSYDDLIGRSYSYTGVVRVVDVDDFASQIAAPAASLMPLLYPNFFYNPNIDLNMQPDLNATFSFPSGLFSQNVVIDYAAQPPQNVHSRGHAGLFYELEASNLADGQPAQLQPGQTYSVTLQYDEAILPSGTNEADLGLYYWSNDGWTLEKSSVVDANANQVTATPGHLSLWAVLDKERLYLPAVIR